jgi:hypothetical protein
MNDRLRIGYIPLVDAAALVVAVDKGFAADEGLDVELVREVSWSNVRDKLNIGLFDAAHLLSPVAVASSLGIGHVRVPLIAPFNLGYNGNAITVTPDLMAALQTSPLCYYRGCGFKDKLINRLAILKPILRILGCCRVYQVLRKVRNCRVNRPCTG